MHLLTIPSWYSDLGPALAGSFFRDQALSYSENGYKSGVIAPDASKKGRHFPGRSAVEFLDDQGVATYRVVFRPFGPRFPGRNDWFWEKYGLLLFDTYIQSHGIPDIIHAHCCLPAGHLAYKIKRIHQIPYIVTEHRCDYQEARHRKWQKKRIQTVIEHSSAMVTVGQHLGNLMTAQFPEAMKEWSLVPNTLSGIFYECDLDKRDENPDEFTFITVGMLNGRKRHDDLLVAFSLAFQNDPTVNLRIVGDGPELGYLKGLAENHGILDRVEFAGLKSPIDIRRLLEASDAFVLTSTAETFGVVLIEALATGMPVISTDCGGPSDIVSSANGVLVPTRHVGRLSEAMALIRNTSHSFDRKAISKETVSEFNQTSFFRRMDPLIQEVVKNTS